MGTAAFRSSSMASGAGHARRGVVADPFPAHPVRRLAETAGAAAGHRDEGEEDADRRDRPGTQGGGDVTAHLITRDESDDRRRGIASGVFKAAGPAPEDCDRCAVETGGTCGACGRIREASNG